MKSLIPTLILMTLCAAGAAAEPNSFDALKELLGLAPEAAVDAKDMKIQFAALAASAKKAGNTDLFLQKHPQEAAKLQAMAVVHLPVKRGWCSVCHASADDASVMNEEGNGLCLACHKPANPALMKAHMGVTKFSDKCTVCHNPHASSEAKLLQPQGQHPAFSSCEMCHSGPSTDGEPALKKPLREACQMCHPQIEEAFKDKIVHGALRMGMCAACHNPHFSPRRKLFQAEPQQFCRECHNIPDRGHPFGKHRSFKEGTASKGSLPASFDCTSCHRPHSGEVPNLLRAPRKELCLNCHKM